jgi:predicted small secreted protein
VNIRTLLFGAILLLACLAAAGSNTIQGIGKDIQRGGEALQRATD